jgi:hypothetical protein
MLGNALGDTIRCQSQPRQNFICTPTSQSEGPQQQLPPRYWQRKLEGYIFVSMKSSVLTLGSLSYGTKMAVAVAWVSLTASATFLKTGSPRCSVPAFLGFVPPTTFVPVRSCQCFRSSRFVELLGVLAYHTRSLVRRGNCDLN